MKKTMLFPLAVLRQPDAGLQFERHADCSRAGSHPGQRLQPGRRLQPACKPTPHRYAHPYTHAHPLRSGRFSGRAGKP